MGGSQAKTRVLILDDQPMIRRGLADLISEASDLLVCGEAGNANEALDLIGAARPDLAIIDIALKDVDGIELTRDIQERYPQVRILVFSMRDEEIYAERALRAGASGYLIKAEAAGTIMSAIRGVLAGKIYTSAKMADRLMHRVVRHPHDKRGATSDIGRLSNRELQIFRLIGDGVRIREIAAQLRLSVRTVETHRVNIKQKLGIRRSAELLRYAITLSRSER